MRRPTSSPYNCLRVFLAPLCRIAPAPLGAQQQQRTMVSFRDKPLMGPLTLAEWEAFLENDPPDDGVRLVLRRRPEPTTRGGGGGKEITYPDALDVALCHGWIDSQASRHEDDNDNYQVRAFTPRRPRSRWSQVNRQHVERLAAAGRMRAPGWAEVARAQADGRWDAAYRMRTAEPDAAFRAALDANPRAGAFWASLGRTKRFPFLFRLQAIKRPETRAKKLGLFVETLARGETLK